MTREEVDKALKELTVKCESCNGHGGHFGERCSACGGDGFEGGGGATYQLFVNLLGRIDALETELAALRGKP